MSMTLKQLANKTKKLQYKLQEFIDERRVELEEKRYADTYKKEQSPDREPWKPRVTQLPWKINDRTGNLKNSREITKDKVEYTAEYASFVDAVRPLISDETDKQTVEQLKLDTVKFIRKNLK